MFCRLKAKAYPQQDEPWVSLSADFIVSRTWAGFKPAEQALYLVLRSLKERGEKPSLTEIEDLSGLGRGSRRRALKAKEAKHSGRVALPWHLRKDENRGLKQDPKRKATTTS